MPEINLSIGTHHLTVTFESGNGGFIMVQDETGSQVLLDESDDGALVVTHLGPDEAEPLSAFDFDARPLPDAIP